MNKLSTTKQRTRWAKVALALLAVCLGLGGVAYAFNPLKPGKPDGAVAGASGKGAKWLSIRTTPSTRTVSPGDAATYALRIRRMPRAAGRRVSVSFASRLPTGASASFNTGSTRSSRVRLSIRTKPDTPAGNYRLRALAYIGSKGRAETAMNLNVNSSSTTSHHHGVAIGGDLQGVLEPGITLPLDLKVTNAGSSELEVSGLRVSIEGLIAPKAEINHPCTLNDFSVDQFSGSYGFKVPPSSTMSLRELGFPEDRLPQITMLNPALNQNGCKGASLRFAYSATGGAR